MDLVIDEVVELEHVHVTYCYRTVEVLTCSSVSERELSALVESALFEQLDDILLACSVEYRRCYVPSLFLGRETEVDFKYLSYVHTGRYAQRVQHYLQRTAVFEERHILFRKDP